MRSALAVFAALLAFVALAGSGLANPPPSTGGPEASALRYRWSAHEAGYVAPMGAVLVPGSCVLGDPCTAGGLGDDEESACLPLPTQVAVVHFGAPRSCVHVHSNGYLSFAGTGSAWIPPRALPSGTVDVLAGFWADIVPCQGHVRYAVTPSEFIAEWSGVAVRTPGSGDLVCGQQPITFQVRLHGDVVTMQYLHANSAARIGATASNIVINGEPASAAPVVLGDAPVTIGLDEAADGLTYASGPGIRLESWQVTFRPNRAPTVYIDGWPGATEDQPFTGAVYGYDPEGDPFTLSSFVPRTGTLTWTAAQWPGPFPGYQAVANFTYTPALDFHGAVFLDAVAVDPWGASTNAALYLPVTPVNDAPTLTPSGDVRVNRHAGPQTLAWATDIAPGPANEAAQSLAISVTADDPTLFTVQPTLSMDGVLRFEPGGTKGTATVTVTLFDNGGTLYGGVNKATTTFLIQVGGGR